ncbi:MAG: CHAT domain-containing protein, partial [Bacteroidetes bacterium]|nr:CHAT domain-containing protein [Bacteroidota bacterium]
IRTSWALYEHSEDENYLREAFYISERSKANLLMEALRESEAQQFAGIDPELLVLEAQIQSELNDLDKRLFDARQGETKVEEKQVSEWESKQFALKQSFDSLKKSIETHHPEYFQLKYNNEVSGLDEIQKKVPDETTLLEYFVGDSNLYMFVIYQEGYHAIKQAVNPRLVTQIKDVREGIYQWYFDPNATEKEMQIYLGRYQKNASDLYASLIAPVKNQLGNLSEKLVIIPDGPLGYLPFEVLLSESASDKAIVANLPYLLRDHSISYSYSVNLWSELKDRKRGFTGKEGVLAFAPSFTRKDEVASNREVVPNNYFTPLQYNQDEAKAIHETFGGQMFLGESATLNAFYENMSDFPIIHLASHGKTHDKDSRYSYIAFADPRDTAQKQLLYVSDLYNLHFNADLVVLSACETGLGTLYRGEGITSLARAFTYAGAQSIATTLWQVDDQTSAILMKTFYEFLDQGFSKDEALRQAKLKLIEDQYDPFFWAGYILIGDAEPARKPGRTYLWLLFVVGGVLVTVVWGEWWKRRGKIDL